MWKQGIEDKEREFFVQARLVDLELGSEYTKVSLDENSALFYAIETGHSSEEQKGAEQEKKEQP